MDLQGLTIKEKIKLFQELYTDIASKGINGDTELAHVNKREAAVLKAMGGSGTVNEVTGLRQYDDWFGGDDDPPPQQQTGTTTVRNVADLPDYFKPYAEKLLATAEQVYDQPYKAYEGQRLADPTSAEMSALSGLEQLFTKGTGEFDEEGVELREFSMPGAEDLKTAKDLSATGAAQFSDMAPADFQSKYMSPYQQAVTDIQLREAEKQAARTRNQLASQAAKTGAFGGSRAAIQDMMQRDQEARTLSDIQATGLQAAYDKGLTQFEADRAAARAGAGQLGQLSQQEQAQTLTGLGALQTAGEAQRSLAQQPLDLAYEEFGRQQMAPKQAIQEMSGVLRGIPVTPTTYKTAQQYEAAPTLGQQLLTAGSVAGGISAGMGKKWFGNAEGGLIGLADGGSADIPKKSGGINPRIIELMEKRRFPRAKPPSQHPFESTEVDIESMELGLPDDILETDVRFRQTGEGLPPDILDTDVRFPGITKVSSKGTVGDLASGPEIFDFEAALPFFAMAAKAQEPGSSVYKGLEAYGKTKGEQTAAKTKALQAKALSKYYEQLGEAGLIKAKGSKGKSFREYASEIIKGANYALNAFDAEIKAIGDDPNMPDKTNKIAAIKKEKEKYLAMIERMILQMRTRASGERIEDPLYTSKRTTKAI